MITLGVIGVVAALTIPNAFSEYKKHVTVNKLRHTLALLKTAEGMAVQEYGDIRNWDFINLDYSSSHTINASVVNKYYFPYLKTQKCNYSAHVTSSKGVVFIDVRDDNYVCLPDGVVLYGNTLGVGYLGTILYADLNGMRGPNVVGKDIFTFLINRPIYKSDDYNTSSYRVVKCPVGISTCFAGPYQGAAGYYWEGDEATLIKYCSDGSGNVSTQQNEGNSCSHMIELAGWKIPKNYPINF